MRMPQGTCTKCNEVFFATPGYFDRVGNVCAGCAGLPQDEILEEEDVLRAGY
jgi:hypothetical protein